MFTTLTTIILTASTAVVCAAAIAARESHPLLVVLWLVEGAVGGFFGGLGFAYFVHQLRAWSLAKPQPSVMWTDVLISDWDLRYAQADLGWTLGMVAVIVLDVQRWLVEDWHYLLAGTVPLFAAILFAWWAWWRRRYQASVIRPARTAMVLLAGFLLGTVTVSTWVGLSGVMCWMVALVVSVHLAVSFAVLANLPLRQ